LVTLEATTPRIYRSEKQSYLPYTGEGNEGKYGGREEEFVLALPSMHVVLLLLVKTEVVLA